MALVFDEVDAFVQARSHEVFRHGAQEGQHGALHQAAVFLVEIARQNIDVVVRWYVQAFFACYL